MGRKGKVICKRVVGLPKKKNCRKEDEDDESYVAEEESSFESDTFNEESFDASEANSSAAAAEEKITNAKPKSRKGYYSGRRRSSVSDYELEDDDYDDDEDFSPDATDNEDWEEDSLAFGDTRVSARRRTTKQGGRKFKRKVSEPKVNRKVSRRSNKVVAASGRRKRTRVEASSVDEDSLIVKGRSAVKGRRKNSKKVSKRTVKSRSAGKKRSSIDSDSFDSDFLTSDDDLSIKVRVAVDSSENKKRAKPVRRNKKLKANSETSDSDFVVSDKDLLDDDIVVHARPRKISRTERKNVRTSRKQLSVESECTDSDDGSENEVKDLEIERTLNKTKHQGSSGKKGKEKEADDLAKQLCGICLSEEHKGTIQGILNCCSHFFCFSCIMEWSKVESRCPLCKRRFVTITKSSRSDPMLQMRRPVIRVQTRDQVYQPSEEELRVLLDPYEDVVCMECHQGGDDSLMLLCDICDSSAHSYCVGLGSEVPEGNWYCECCKLADEGASHSQVLDTREASSSHTHGGVEENCSRNFQSSSIFQRSVSSQGQSSSQGFDLNVPPRNFVEDNGVVSASQASGAGASTLSGRRALHQRIRILLSNNRARQLFAGPNRTDTSLHTEAVRSLLEHNGEQLRNSERPNSFCTVSVTGQQQENSRNFSHTNANFVSLMSNEGGCFRHVEGAKEQIQSLVKSCLNRLPREVPLELSAYKKIARKGTHTILAACGIQHCSRVVSSLLQPPDKCCHDLDGGPVNLLTGCCPSCFGDYIKDVVKMIIETL